MNSLNYDSKLLVRFRQQVPSGAGRPPHLIMKKNDHKPESSLRVPDLPIILTEGQMAYTRDNGVKIIPLRCLKD